MNVLSVIKLLPESNEQVLKFSEELKEILDSGEVNPLDVLLCIKGFEKVIKNVKDLLNELSVSELSKYQEKDVKYKNAELKIMETGVKYYYNGCNDFVLNGFETEKQTLDSNIKNRQNFLKTIDPDNGMEIINEETGELVRIYSPVKSSTTSAKVTLK